MNKLAQTALIPAALALTLTGALGTASAQTTPQARPNVLFLADTGRPGAVDVYVDGTRIEAGVQATDRPGTLFLTPGTHVVTVKTNRGGEVLATTTVNVLGNTLYALSLQNDEDTPGYTLALASGAAMSKVVNGD
ncbi:DUF4397 domain-containing protein [Deinococcus planocerae]|uniref:DUF4397 domain-containing protein n=1 Tax=Deinococcus planocerae TaxID=1737569 RepID=UPI000C7EF2AC|nr:DUF4397 domain-containing protein [Deinococcus planocerae]